MKKKVILGIIFVLGIFTCGVTAADLSDYNYESLEEIYYWDNLMETTEINQQLHQMNFNYSMKLLEYDEGTTLDNGFDTELSFGFGVMPNTEVKGYLYSFNDYTNVIGEFKSTFYEKKDLSIAAMGRLFYIKDEFTTPSVKLLSDKVINDQMVIHNNIQLFFYEDGLIGKRIENGLSYQIDPRNMLKIRLKSFFINKLKETMFDFRVAFKHEINEQTKYLVYAYNENENYHIENVIEFKPVESLRLSVNMIINSQEGLNNSIVFRGEKDFGERLTVLSEYRKVLTADGYRYLKTGISYTL